jgi:hypothetical protein
LGRLDSVIDQNKGVRNKDVVKEIEWIRFAMIYRKKVKEYEGQSF